MRAGNRGLPHALTENRRAYHARAMIAATRHAFPALFAGATLIGLAPIFVRWVDVGYTAAAFWRVALSVPVLFALMARQPTTAPRAPSAWGGLWLAGAFFAGDLAVWHQSVRLTSVANATLLANLAPVFVTVAAFVLFREKIRPGFMAGLVLALIGSATLVARSAQAGAEPVLGDLHGIGAAVFYAGYQLSVSRLRQTTAVLPLMAWSTLATAVVLLPLVLVLNEPLWPASWQGWAVLLGLALVSHCAGQGLIAYGMAHVSAAMSSVSLLVQPVAAALFAWLLLAEPLGLLQALGGAVVLAGILICKTAAKNQGRREPP